MLLAEYSLNGEDPIVLPAEDPAGKRFSSAEYATGIVGTICQKLEDEHKKEEVQTLYQEAIIFAASKHQDISQQVKAVKLADRITNLQPPPAEWTADKCLQYAKDAQIILDELRDGNQFLAERLEAKISEYRNLNKRFLLDGF